MEDDFVISGPEEDCFIPNDKTLGQYIFECLRKRHGDDVIAINALTDETLTCKMLLEQTVKLIKVLQKQGVQQGDVISFSSENSLEFFLPVLAAFAMGVTLNLLNAFYTVGEIKHALNIVKPKIIICSDSTMANVEAATEDIDCVQTVLVIGLKSSTHNAKVINLKNELHNTVIDSEEYVPEDFDSTKQGAIILLSSGTTGLPKGVLMTHETLKMDLFSMSDPRYVGLKGTHTVLVVIPFFFTYGAFIISTSFVQPIKLVILPKFEPKTFLHTIEHYKITKLPVAPSTVLFLAKSPLVKQYDLSSLDDVLSGGSTLSLTVLEEATRALNGIEIRQGYGLTELGTCTFEHRHSSKPGTVGKVTLNFKGKVWDADSNKNMGPYRVGELCFKRQSAITGYIGVTDTHDVDKQGFFHTGDLGYYDDDGYFFITGRTKDLIKYKGMQVSPTEIENLLLEHSGVKDCGVIGIPDDRAGELPLAFVVCQDAQLTKDEVIKYVADRISLPKQLHGGVVFVNSIPRNSSGKILRIQLQQMYRTLELE